MCAWPPKLAERRRVMDQKGHKLVHTNITGNDFAYFLERVKPYRNDLTVVCECTFNWPCHAVLLML